MLQYLRCCRVSLSGPSGGLTIDCRSDDPAPFKVSFRITHAEKAFPQNAIIAIYNLTVQNQRKFINKEFNTVILQCGYGDVLSLAFKGKIIQARLTKENVVDSVVLVTAVDSPEAFQHGTISETLAHGSNSYGAQIDRCLKAWAPFGVTRGFIADLSKITPPRARVLHGMVADKLSEICQSTNTAWHVRGGQLYVIKNNETLPGVVVLNSSTGMIGRAEQTIEGIVVRSLLNPQIRPGTKISINEASINRGAYSPDYLAKNETLYPDIAGDGIYKVLYTDEVGDTRGNDWYTIAYCLSAAGGNIPLNLAPRGIGIPGNDGR